MITMNEIHEFRKMMVADLGADEKFFWKGLKYTISCDEIEPKTTKEELEQLEQDIKDFDEHYLQY